MRKIAQFGNVKVYRNVEWNEYVVKDSTDEATWYHTDCKEDALNTAQSIANNKN